MKWDKDKAWQFAELLRFLSYRKVLSEDAHCDIQGRCRRQPPQARATNKDAWMYERQQNSMNTRKKYGLPLTLQRL